MAKMHELKVFFNSDFVYLFVFHKQKQTKTNRQTYDIINEIENVKLN